MCLRENVDPLGCEAAQIWQKLGQSEMLQVVTSLDGDSQIFSLAGWIFHGDNPHLLNKNPATLHTNSKAPILLHVHCSGFVPKPICVADYGYLMIPEAPQIEAVEEACDGCYVVP